MTRARRIASRRATRRASRREGEERRADQPDDERAALRSRNNFGRCWFSWLVNGVVWHILKTDSTYEFTFFSDPPCSSSSSPRENPNWIHSAPRGGWGEGFPLPSPAHAHCDSRAARPSCIASRINFARPPTLSSARGVAACQSARSRAGIVESVVRLRRRARRFTERDDEQLRPTPHGG